MNESKDDVEKEDMAGTGTPTPPKYNYAIKRAYSTTADNNNENNKKKNSSTSSSSSAVGKAPTASKASRNRRHFQAPLTPNAAAAVSTAAAPTTVRRSSAGGTVHDRLYRQGMAKVTEAHNAQIDLLADTTAIPLRAWEQKRQLSQSAAQIVQQVC
jgi:hypothetical protein